METIDLDMLRTYIFLPQSIYSDSMRDTLIAVNGIGVYGYVPLGGLGDLTYQALYGETGIATDGTMALYMESEANSRLIDVKSHPVLRLHTEWMPPFEGIRLTGSVMLTDIELRYVTTEQTFWASESGIPVGWEFPYLMDNMMIVGTGLEIARERLVFLAEYEYFETNVTQDREEWERYRSAGGYIGLTYRFTDRFDLGTYYSLYYDDLDDRKGEQYEAAGLPNYAAWQKDWTVTARADMNEYWILKGEIHVIDGTALLLNQHNPEGTERESVLFAVKATYSF
jgi:hypothetical protein